LQEVKQLTGSIILGDIDIKDTEKTLSVLQYNNHTLEKALLFYQNQRYFIGGRNAVLESSNYDLEMGLDYIIEWFHSLLSPLNIKVEVAVNALEIKGSLSNIELIFHNAIFNAIQAIKEKNEPQNVAFIRVTAQKMEGNVLVEIIDNGISLPKHDSLEDLIAQTRGNGLQIIQSQMQEMGGKCLGFRQIDAETKALQLVFKV
jgi:nitrogen fixation/metabolism regulation signal transduction histidine kinase